MADTTTKEQTIEALKRYFAAREDVQLAFLFGSQAKGHERHISDWDIALYFTPEEYGELEVTRQFQAEQEIWDDLITIIERDIDLVVLNRARPPMVFSILNSGIKLTIKDRALYLKLLLATHFEAVDFWAFAEDFWRIQQRSHSLSPEDRAQLIEHLTFLKNEFADLPDFKNIDQHTYERERSVKRNLDRWVETLVMATLDSAKIVLAADHHDLPQTYRDTLYVFGTTYGDAQFAHELASCAQLRNIIAHEYLDLRFKRIQQFISTAEKIYPRLFGHLEKLLLPAHQ